MSLPCGGGGSFVVDLLFYVPPTCVGVLCLCLSLFWYALLHALSSFAIILTKNRDLIALLLLSFGCLVTVNAQWLFLTVPWVGLQFMIVAFLGL